MVGGSGGGGGGGGVVVLEWSAISGQLIDFRHSVTDVPSR